MIHEADAAMYRAKARGRHRFELVDPSEPLPPANRVIVERELRQALADGDLRIVFQPFVGSVTARRSAPKCCCAGSIPPRATSGDIAEDSGLILPIGEWMLRHACRHAARSQQQHSDFLLTVNVSASQLSDPGIVAAVQHAVDASGLPPKNLGLELTEQVLVGDERDALATLNELKALGVTLLLDDFGTGFSSLRHLKRFPIDVVKIDRSFIQGLDQDDSRGDDAAIVAAIVGMSRATGKCVIPEGIETEAQVQALLELGCDTGQGYFFSCPMRVRHVGQWLAGEAEPLHATLNAAIRGCCAHELLSVGDRNEALRRIHEIAGVNPGDFAPGDTGVPVIAEARSDSSALRGLKQRAAALPAAALGAALVTGVAAAKSRRVRRIARRKSGFPPGVEADDGALLHVETDGPADAAVTVVFAHGFAARLQMYERQRAVLRDRARMVLFDQRGHGRSGWGGRSSATIERLGRDLGEVIDRFAPSGPVVVIGHSMGGMAVMALAEHRPELFGGKVAAVALMSTSAGQLAQSHLPPLVARVLLSTGIARALLWGAWLVAPLVDRLAPFKTSLGRSWLRKHLFGRIAPAELVSEMENMWAYTSRSIGTAFYPAMVFHDGSPGVRALASVPALVLAGCADAAIPAYHSVELAKELGPAARLVLVPDAGHMVNMTHARQVNRALLDLVARVEIERPTAVSV